VIGTDCIDSCKTIRCDHDDDIWTERLNK
jgi:hypothetical protein